MTFDFSNINLTGHFGGHSKAFKCPQCDGFSSHIWNYYPVSINKNYDDSLRFIIVSQCYACEDFSIWLTNKLPIRNSQNLSVIHLETENASSKLLYPSTLSETPLPNKDMPIEIKETYLEASKVLNLSPRASAALSRMAIEKLVDELDAEGKDLNRKIGNLVSKGMPIQIQRMLDSVRVIGNNAVHPGQIDIKDNKKLALSLLHFINLIVDNRISQPKMINEVYNSLPESYKKSIEKRDN